MSSLLLPKDVKLSPYSKCYLWSPPSSQLNLTKPDLFFWVFSTRFLTWNKCVWQVIWYKCKSRSRENCSQQWYNVDQLPFPKPHAHFSPSGDGTQDVAQKDNRAMLTSLCSWRRSTVPALWLRSFAGTLLSSFSLIRLERNQTTLYTFGGASSSPSPHQLYFNKLNRLIKGSEWASWATAKEAVGEEGQAVSWDGMI